MIQTVYGYTNYTYGFQLDNFFRFVLATNETLLKHFDNSAPTAAR
jgi:hypothetical protein